MFRPVGQPQYSYLGVRKPGIHRRAVTSDPKTNDALADYSFNRDLHDGNLRRHAANGRYQWVPKSEEPTHSLKVVNSDLWKGQNWDRIEMMDKTVNIRKVDAYDGTLPSWAQCGHKAPKQQTIIRSSWRGWHPPPAHQNLNK